MNRAVPDTGPWTARLLIVGEAGGKEEGRLGEPFVGPTGNELKRRVEKAGLNWATDVRRANVVPYEMVLPKTVGGMKEVVRQNWDSLNNTLVNGDYRAVLAVGRAALYRLTGKTGIKAETGGVFCPVDASVMVGSEFKATRVRDVPVVACIHPQAVMRTKLGAEWALINVAVQRACNYATGPRDWFDAQAQQPQVDFYGDWNLEELDRRLAACTTVAVDTEFSVVTGKPFLIGIEEVGEDTTNVMSIRPDPGVVNCLKKHMLRRDLTKVFHHFPADVGSLYTLGIDVAPPIADTLLAQATLYPDLPAGLSKVTLFYLDHWKSWKDMQKDDPVYNAIDVRATGMIWPLQAKELVKADLWDVYVKEVLPAAMLTLAMEARGMKVDKVAQAATIKEYKERVAQLEGEIKAELDAVFNRRADEARKRVEELDAYLVNSVVKDRVVCPVAKHETYDGSRGKKFTSKEGCRCKEIREAWLLMAGKGVTEAKAERAKLVTKLKKWTETGFDPGNSHHKKWVFYNEQGLALPPQRNRDGGLTTNSDAVAKLLMSPKVIARPDVVALLHKITEHNHLEKMVSTFLNPPVDQYGLCHPEYRVFGAGTGRPAGGSDADLSDKRSSQYAFNALNIPDEVRHIFVPRSEEDAKMLRLSFHVKEKEGTDEDDEDSPGEEE